MGGKGGGGGGGGRGGERGGEGKEVRKVTLQTAFSMNEHGHPLMVSTLNH